MAACPYQYQLLSWPVCFGVAGESQHWLFAGGQRRGGKAEGCEDYPDLTEEAGGSLPQKDRSESMRREGEGFSP